MKKLTISSRLSLLVGLLSVLLLGIGLLGLYGISRANEGLRVVYLERTVPATYMGRIQSDLLASRLAVTMPLAIPTPENIEAAQTLIKKSTDEIAELWKNYSAGPFSGEEAKLVQQFTENYGKFLNEGLNPTMQAVATYDLSQAKLLLGRTLPQLYEAAKKTWTPWPSCRLNRHARNTTTPRRATRAFWPLPLAPLCWAWHSRLCWGG